MDILNRSMDSAIRIIGTSGREGKAENQFAQPRGICMDHKTKEIFVVDCNNHRVQVYHLSSLAFIRQIGKGIQGSSAGSLNYAVGICIDDQNQIFVADTNNHRIVVFNHVTGGQVRTIGSQGETEGLFSSPYGVAVDISSGLLYVTDYDNHRIQVFNKDSGEFVRVIGLGVGSQPGHLNQPIVVCLDEALHHLYVADYSNNRVQIFNLDSGEFLRSLGAESGPDSMSGPRGLCVSHASDILLVSDRENHRVQIYQKSTGTLLRHLGTSGVHGVQAGQFYRPMEMCISPEDGVLLVVDGYNHRVQLFELPELRAERDRLRAISAVLEAQARQKTLGRVVAGASGLAVSSAICAQNVSVDVTCGTALVKFPEHGPLFDVLVTSKDVTRLMQSFKSCPFPVLSGSAVANTINTIISNTATNKHKIFHKQSAAFLSILEDLASSLPNDAESLAHPVPETVEHCDFSAYELAPPALFALQALLQRGWTPDHISISVLTLLVGMLSRVNQCVSSSGGSSGEVRSECAVIITAVMNVLKASLRISTDCAETVLHTVLAAADGQTEFSLSQSVLVDREGDVSSTESAVKNDVSVLMAYFEVIVSIVVPSDTTITSVTTSQSMVSSHITSQHHTQHEIDSTPSFVTTPLRTPTKHHLVAPTSTTTTTTSSSRPSSGHTVITTITSDVESAEMKQEKDILGLMFGANLISQLRGVVSGTGDVNNLNNSNTTDSVKLPMTELCSMINAVYRINKLRNNSTTTTTNNNTTSLLLPDLQLDLFKSATQYFNAIRSIDPASDIFHLHNLDTQITTPKPLVRKSRGGRNIWLGPDSQCELSVGDLVDAQDKERCWFESVVVEIIGNNGGPSGGGVKVHFMGWGSKWDDIVNKNEITTRIAPLNSHSKDWRSELFVGSLIEIKCNDDIHNQKWMWGKVAALNTREDWLEVTYAFSQEPVVTKRAWLHGETICPIGMHTKEKSKAEAMKIVRPLKKADEIIVMEQKTSLASNERHESAFFATDDDHLDITPTLAVNNDSSYDEQPTSTGGLSNNTDSRFTPTLRCSTPARTTGRHSIGGVGGSNPGTPVSRTPAGSVRTAAGTPARDLESPLEGSADGEKEDRAVRNVIVLARHLFESLMREVMSTISSALLSLDITVDSHQLNAAAETVISAIGHSPYKGLLVPYFTRCLVFQSGVKARLQTSGCLERAFCDGRFDVLRDVRPISVLLERLTALSDLYCNTLTRFLTDCISPRALKHTLSRVTATVDRCGVSSIATELLTSLASKPEVRQGLLSMFLHEDRFTVEAAQVRSVLTRLSKAATASDRKKFQSCFEDAVSGAALRSLDFVPESLQTPRNESKWAQKLVSGVLKVFHTARSVSRLELFHTERCRMTAERSLREEIRLLSGEQMAGLGRALALRIHSVMLAAESAVRDESANRVNVLEDIIELIQTVSNEHLLFHFEAHYRVLLAQRLLNCQQQSLTAERAALEALPVMIKAQTMIVDVTHAPVYSAEFSRYMLCKVDSCDESGDEDDDCEDSAAGEMSRAVDEKVVDLVLRRKAFSVQILSGCCVWPVAGACTAYSTLRMPSVLRNISIEFDNFYAAQQDAIRLAKNAANPEDTQTVTIPRKLTWCRSLGSVTIACRLVDGSKMDVIVTEPQCALLMSFNCTAKTLRVDELCTGTGLCFEELRGVILSLTEGDQPLLEVASNLINNELLMTSRLRVSRELLGGDYQVETDSSDDEAEEAHRESTSTLSYVQSAREIVCRDGNLAVEEWRLQLLDASIVRVLKLADRNCLGDFSPPSGDIEDGALIPSSVLSEHGLVEAVRSDSESKRPMAARPSGHFLLPASDILRRCEHLASIGFIDKVTRAAQSNSASITPVVGYCYIAVVEKSDKLVDTALVLSGSELFDQLSEIVTLHAPVEVSNTSVELTPVDEDESCSYGECKEGGDDREMQPEAPIVAVSTDSRSITESQFVRGIVNWVAATVECVCDAPTSLRDYSLSIATDTLSTSLLCCARTVISQVDKLIHQRNLAARTSHMMLQDKTLYALNHPPPLKTADISFVGDSLSAQDWQRAVFFHLPQESITAVWMSFQSLLQLAGDEHTTTTSSNANSVEQAKNEWNTPREVSVSQMLGSGRHHIRLTAHFVEFVARHLSETTPIDGATTSRTAVTSRSFVSEDSKQVDEQDRSNGVNISMAQFVALCLRYVEPLLRSSPVLPLPQLPLAPYSQSRRGNYAFPPATASFVTSPGESVAKLTLRSADDGERISRLRPRDGTGRSIPVSLMGSFDQRRLFSKELDQMAVELLGVSLSDMRDELRATGLKSTPQSTQSPQVRMKRETLLHTVGGVQRVTKSHVENLATQVTTFVCETIEKLDRVCLRVRDVTQSGIRHTASSAQKSDIDVAGKVVLELISGLTVSLADESTVPCWLTKCIDVSPLTLSSVLQLAFAHLDCDGDAHLSERDLVLVESGDVLIASRPVSESVRANDSSLFDSWLSDDKISPDFLRCIQQTHTVMRLGSDSTSAELNMLDVATLLVHFDYGSYRLLDAWFADEIAVRHQCGLFESFPCQTDLVRSNQETDSDQTKCQSCHRLTQNSDVFSSHNGGGAFCRTCWLADCETEFKQSPKPAVVKSAVDATSVDLSRVTLRFIQHLGGSEDMQQTFITHKLRALTVCFAERTTVSPNQHELRHSDLLSDNITSINDLWANNSSRCNWCVDSSTTVGRFHSLDTPHSPLHSGSIGLTLKYEKFCELRYVDSSSVLQTRMNELSARLRDAGSEQQFLFLSLQLSVWEAVRGAGRLVDYLLTINSNFTSTHSPVPKDHATCLVTFLRRHFDVQHLTEDLLHEVVSAGMKLKGKWTTCESLTRHRAERIISAIRVCSEQLLSCIASIVDRFSIVQSSKIGLSTTVEVGLRSLVTQQSVSGLHSPPEKWTPFGTALNCSSHHTTTPMDFSQAQTAVRAAVEALRQAVTAVTSSTSSGSSKALSRVLGQITKLCAISPHQTELIQCGAVDVLLSALTQWATDSTVIDEGWRAMTALFKTDNQNVSTLLRSATNTTHVLVERLCEALTTHGQTCPSVIPSCCGLIELVVRSGPDNKQLFLSRLEGTPFFITMLRVFRDATTSPPHKSPVEMVVKAMVACVDRQYTNKSSFVVGGVCESFFDTLITTIAVNSSVHNYAVVNRLKVQLCLAVVQLSSSNRFMQTRLLEASSIFSEVAEYLQQQSETRGGYSRTRSSESEKSLLRCVCWAVCELSTDFPAGQIRLGVSLDCGKYLVRLLQLVPLDDVSTLSYLLRAMTALSTGNKEMQTLFRQIDALNILESKHDETEQLMELVTSYETRSQLSLLVLSLKYATESIGSGSVRCNRVGGRTHAVDRGGSLFSQRLMNERNLHLPYRPHHHHHRGQDEDEEEDDDNSDDLHSEGSDEAEGDQSGDEEEEVEEELMSEEEEEETDDDNM